MVPPTWCKSPTDKPDAPNLKKLLADKSILKIFHFARFDVGLLYKTFGVMAEPIYCTKIASRLARTYTDKHGLKDLTRELLGIEVSKQQQSSDWGAERTDRCAGDLRGLRRAASACAQGQARCHARARKAAPNSQPPASGFLPDRVRLDLAGWAADDIFSHSA